MDERYFSDKRPKSQPGGRDKYIEADYFDENFSLEFKKGKGNAQSFEQQRVDDDESFVSFAQKLVAEDIDALFDDASQRRSAEVKASENVRMTENRVPNNRTPKGAPVTVRPAAERSPLVNTARAPGNTPVRHPEIQRAQSSYGVYNTMPGDPSRVPSGDPVDFDGEKKPKRKSKALKIIACVLLVIIAATAVGGFFLLRGVEKELDLKLDKVNYDNSIVDNKHLPSDAPVSDEVINILLIGSDERADGSVKGQRSDTMILLSIDSKNKQIKLTSILRDCYVEIPYTDSNGTEKIMKSKMNAAYSKAGAQGVMDTIEHNFSVDVHDYISIDFEAFEKVIDLLGGVTVDGITEKEARYMNREADTNIVAGSNHMNGYEALWYCRIRKLDSDFYRTQRQRKVLSAIIDKIKTDPEKMLGILDEALPYVTTSISKNEIKDMTKTALGYVSYDVVQQQIPADGTWRDSSVNGSYIIDFDISENKKILQNFIYEKAEVKE